MSNRLEKIINLKINNFEIKVPIKDEMGVVKEGFPIPSPSGQEDKDMYIGRCMKEIGGEYEQEQALAICYAKWDEK
jgi:hypothetical protein